MDFRQFYVSNLESYLTDTVRPRFLQQGFLSAADFFCIIIWKANKVKTRIAKKLLDHGYENLEDAVKALTSGLFKEQNSKDKMRYLIKDWGLRLPVASAILTILYPDEFTLYDPHICDSLGSFADLKNCTQFENLWFRYMEFKDAVERSTPGSLNLRDKDRYLWGKSFYEDLIRNVNRGFPGTL